MKKAPKKSIHEVELAPRQVQQLVHDALVLASAVTLYVPATHERPHRSARRVMRLLFPGTLRLFTKVAKARRL